MIQYDTDNELLLYDVGARQAQGQWLLFTEAHCAAEPDCLERLAAFLENHRESLVGACLRTATDGNRDPVALAEERWYREGFEQWSREGDWRKVTIRGTAIRRDIYQAIGGFRSEFGCFAESLLAADLHTAGHRPARLALRLMGEPVSGQIPCKQGIFRELAGSSNSETQPAIARHCGRFSAIPYFIGQGNSGGLAGYSLQDSRQIQSEALSARSTVSFLPLHQ